MFVQKNPSTQVAHNGGLGAQRLGREVWMSPQFVCQVGLELP